MLEFHHSNFCEANDVNCDLPYCPATKKILSHMKSCRNADCTFLDCKHSAHLLDTWNNWWNSQIVLQMDVKDYEKNYITSTLDPQPKTASNSQVLNNNNNANKGITSYKIYFLYRHCLISYQQICLHTIS